MENYLTSEVIEKQFSNYKENIFLIMLSFSIFSIIIQFFQNWFLSRKVESYKNDLKRNEIKFSRFNELQIESLKNLYDHIVTFHFKYLGMLNPPFQTHHSLKTNLEGVKKEFWICMEYFHRNRIFLTDELVTTIRTLHDNFKIVETHLGDQWQYLSNIEENHSSSNPQDIYDSYNHEVEFIKKNINQLRSKDKVLTFEKDIKDIRDKTEKYFKELTK